MLRLILANLRRRPLRTLTSVLAVAMTMAIVIITLASYHRVRQNMNGLPSGLNIRALNENESLPLTYADRIRRVPGVKDVEWVRFAGARHPEPGKYGFVMAQMSADMGKNWGKLVDPTPEMMAAFNAEKNAILVDQRTLDAMGWKVGETYQVQTSYGPVSAKPVAVWSGPHIGSSWWHYSYLDELMEPKQGKGRASWFATSCEGAECATLAAAIEREFASDEDPVYVQPILATYMGFVASEFTTFDLLTNFSVFMIFMTAMITAATLATGLRERRAEMGTLHALGFSRATLFRLVLAEALGVCLLGALIGSLPLAAMFSGGGLDLGEQMMGNVRVGAEHVGLAVALGLPFGFLVALWPALGAARVNVVQALVEA